ncbi:uncharacterized protein IWZ02DRAFT_435295 [Phyllosticta citriasiana]|uniref:uncharacterized protein n=1 Tax=Phyllosticta citriasiana TaxID=595635 RepID=UPI0030FD8CE9
MAYIHFSLRAFRAECLESVAKQSESTTPAPSHIFNGLIVVSYSSLSSKAQYHFIDLSSVKFYTSLTFALQSLHPRSSDAQPNLPFNRQNPGPNQDHPTLLAPIRKRKRCQERSRDLIRQKSSAWRREPPRTILLGPRITLSAETTSPKAIGEVSHKRKHRGEGVDFHLPPTPINVDRQPAPTAAPSNQPSTPVTGDPTVPQEIDEAEVLTFAVGRNIQEGERADDPEALSVWTATRRHAVPPGRLSRAQKRKLQHANQHVVTEVLIFNSDELGFASGRLVERRQLLTLYATQMDWEAFLVESVANGWTKIAGQRL